MRPPKGPNLFIKATRTEIFTFLEVGDDEDTHAFIARLLAAQGWTIKTIDGRDFVGLCTGCGHIVFTDDEHTTFGPNGEVYCHKCTDQRPIEDAETLHDLYTLVGFDVPIDVIKGWTDEQKDEAAEYATVANEHADDDGIDPPKIPDHLKPYKAKRQIRAR